MHVSKLNIEKLTLKNNKYRKVIYTDNRMQIVLMCLLPGEFIPMEKHHGTQFFRVESGSASAIVGRRKFILHDGDVLVVPQNTKHQITQRSDVPLKLYTIYTPPQHEDDEVNERMPILVE